jgi:hypothetical protein
LPSSAASGCGGRRDRATMKARAPSPLICGCSVASVPWT